MKKHGWRMIFCLLLIVSLIGCSPKEKSVLTETDIVTQKEIPEGKIPITILVKNAFSIHGFEKKAEEKFPELEIIQVGNYTRDMGIAEYEARLEKDDLTDVVMTWPLEVGEEYWDDRLMDLSGLAVTGKYVTTFLDGISRNGKLYYLPGPSQVRGIVYNKTLFEEKGWQVPKDFDGFLALCQTIEQSGIRSLQLGLGNSEVLDTAFVGYGYEDGFAKPKSAKWLADYNEGIGSFGENFGSSLQTFQRLIDSGVLKKEDLEVQYAQREQMLFTRRCAMVEDSVLLARSGQERAGCTDEFALMPFFNPGENSDWARLYPVCYIGVNAHLQEGKNREKYEMVMQLLQYISTPEGQLALAGDTESMFSALQGVAPPDIPETKDLISALTHGRCARFPTLKNAQGALRSGLAGMVAGTCTAEDVIQMVDRENLKPPIPVPLPVLGRADSDFTVIETGNFVTDAMRKKSGCEIALFLDSGKDGMGNGKGISGRLYKGDLRETDIQRILPDLRGGEKGELWKITMTGADLIQTLEYAIPVDHDVTGWFYYFSGLRMDYAPAAQPGKRIKKITDEQGKPIDLKKNYSIAVMDGTVPNASIQSCEKTGELISDILSRAIRSEKTIAPSGDHRFVVCKP